MALAKPAVLAMVAYIVLAFAILIPLDGSMNCKKNGGETCYDFNKRVMTLILMIIPIGLSIYSIQCMMVGNCVVWSWVNSIFIALWVLLFLLAVVMTTEKRVATKEHQQIVMIKYAT